MRIVVFSDTHLGARSGRTAEARREFDNFVRGQFSRVLSQVDADLVVHAGDVFDMPRPTADLQKFFSTEITRVLDRGIELVVIAGNHDRSLAHSLLEMYYDNLHIVNTTARFEFGDLAITAFPYQREVSGIQRVLDEVRSELFIAHQLLDNSWVGPQRMHFRGSKTLRPPRRGLLISGHVHRAQITSERSVHCGSTIRTSFAEVIEPKGYLVLDVEDGNVEGEFRELPTYPMEVHELEDEEEFEPKDKNARLYLRLLGSGLEKGEVYAQYPAGEYPHLRVGVSSRTRLLYGRYNGGFEPPSFSVKL